MIRIAHPKSDRRHDYRLNQPRNCSIRLVVQGVTMEILDISTGGVAFILPEEAGLTLFTNEQGEPALLFLGEARHPQPVTLELVFRQSAEVHARLQHPDLRAQKRLSAFLVAEQKARIRSARRRLSPGARESGKPEIS